MKTAVVHEWFIDYSGSERVVEQILNHFKEADLFAQIEFLPDELKWFIRNKPVRTSFIQKLPFARTKYRHYFPLMPLAVEQFDLGEYDLIVSSSHAVAKGVITGPHQLHISYVHSPVRYAWDLQHQYLAGSGLDKGLKSLLVRWLLHRFRLWDIRTANGVDHFIANSRFIARRIWKIYRRESEVIYPPVAVDDFEFSTEKEDFYLTASRLVPYKKVDVVVRAFAALPDKKLYVIGDGPGFKNLQKIASPNVEFLGFQPKAVLKTYFQRAKAFVFAAMEDFGITPLEAQACGTPVIAYGEGGCRETLVGLGSDGKVPTGVLFPRQTPESLCAAISLFEGEGAKNISPYACRENALRFSVARFKKEFGNFVDAKISEFRPDSVHGAETGGCQAVN